MTIPEAPTYWMNSSLSDVIMDANLYLGKTPPSGYCPYQQDQWPANTKLFVHSARDHFRVHFDHIDAYRAWHALTGRGPEVYAYQLALWFNQIWS